MNKNDVILNLDVQDNKVYLPCSKAYSDIEFSDNYTGHSYLIDMQDVLQERCSKYDSIHLKLRPSINDIRPFIWRNFVSLQRYTYVVDLVNLSKDFVESVPEYKKWSKENLVLKSRALNTDDINTHLRFLKSKITTRKYKAIHNDLKNHIKELAVVELLDSENVMKAQMVFNRNAKRAEQLFYIDELDFKRNRGGVYAQYMFMLYFKQQGYNEFDFCGANIKKIAIYKSRFPVSLERIYELWFSKNKFKRLARRLLFHQI